MPPRILQISTFARWGGAERVAADLHRAYRARGVEAYFAVGRPSPRDSPGRDGARVIGDGGGATPTDRGGVLAALAASARRRADEVLARALRAADHARGRETFHFPATARLLEHGEGARPQVLHGHNLHGGYFDLRELPRLCRQLPVLLTLHDAWLLSGHCAHAVGCERWRDGCGACPDLSLYPPLQRDGTAHNWRAKQAIYAACAGRLHIAAPSRWLLERAQASMLAPALADARVVENGVDLGVFHPDDGQGQSTPSRAALRAELGVAPQSTLVLLLAGNDSYRDAPAAWRALAAARPANGPLHVLAVGGDDGGPPAEARGALTVHSVPRVDEPARLAACHRAADIYLHVTRADTAPLSVIEAMACGTPVVARAVGGVGEIVACRRREAVAEANGVLSRASDDGELVDAIEALAADAALRHTLGRNGAAMARRRFDLARMRDAYLDWYEQLVEPARSRDAGATRREHGRRAGEALA